MVIKHNIPAKNSLRNLGINNKQTAKNLEKLSTGYKINRAADDAAGLAISEKMRGQIRGLSMAETNCENATALIQTAEGGLNEVHDILHRMRELAVQSANGTYQDDVDREALDLEFQSIKSEIDRIASSTHYNGINLLDGTLGATYVDNTTSSNPQGDMQALLQSFGLSNSSSTLTPFKCVGETATLSVNVFDSTYVYVTLQIGDKTYTGSLDATSPAQINFGDPADPVASLYLDYNLPATAKSFVIADFILYNPGSNNLDNILQQNDALRYATDDSQLIFQIGANGSADQEVGLHVPNMNCGNLGLYDGTTYTSVADLNILTRENGKDAIEVIDAAVNHVSMVRASLGALQNRMEHTINNLGVARENLQAAESSIRDTDMAKEMMEFTKNSILVQASQAMLAQANALPQGLLSLLQ